MVAWRDHEAIIDLMEINSKASFILYIADNNLTDKDWEQIKQYYIMTQKRFKVLLFKMNYDYCVKNDIPFFFDVAVNTGWEANALINLGVCSLYITGQLAHQLDFVDTLPVEIRVRANSSGAPFGYKALIGGWFRPEDLNDLTMIDVCEFAARDNREEQALYRIYAEQKAWPGELYMIVKDIPNEEIMNRMIPPEFQEKRSNCGMRCQSGGHCHFCETITYLANPKVLRPVKEQIEKNND